MLHLSVVKIGGNIVDNPEALDKFLSDFADLKGPKVLVHGGGKVATKISDALGIETQMVDGRRVTDQETVKVVTMVYAGLVNKTIVAKLQAFGCDALGLSGADGDAIRAHKRKVEKGAVDYGFVGDIIGVNDELLVNIVNSDIAPVLAPITHNGSGQLLNTNADTVASAVAVALAGHIPVRLVYCFELPGVLKDINDKNSIISFINKRTYTELKQEGVIADGMIPKMDNCFEAIEEGVSSVYICHADNLLGLLEGKSSVGTQLKA